MSVIISDALNDYVYEYEEALPKRTVKLSGVQKIDISKNGDFSDDCNPVFIQFGNTVTHILSGACSMMYDLTAVVLPSSLVSIGEDAFANTGITQLDIPDGVKRIGFDAFGGTALTSVTLPASLTSIGPYAFSYSCLDSVQVPAGIGRVNYETFSYNYLTAAEIPEGISYIAQGAFANNYIQSINLPNSLRTIEPDVFLGNEIGEVTLPDNVSIYDGSFAWNEPLSSVTIPDNAKIYLGNPFYKCPHISSAAELKVNFERNSHLKNGGIGLMSEDNTLLIPLKGLPTVNIEPIKNIGKYCYANNDNVMSADLTDANLSGISEAAFFW